MEIRRKIAEYMATFDLCESHESSLLTDWFLATTFVKRVSSSPYIIVVPYLIMSLVYLFRQRAC